MSLVSSLLLLGLQNAGVDTSCEQPSPSCEVVHVVKRLASEDAAKDEREPTKPPPQGPSKKGPTDGIQNGI